MLQVKKLDENALLPTVSHPGEDLGYDLYSCEDVIIPKNEMMKVKTGISAKFIHQIYKRGEWIYPETKNIFKKIYDRLVINGIREWVVVDTNIPYGLIFKDRSSMAAKGITVSGGVIDAGYTGELIVMLTNHNKIPFTIKKGDKIVQMLPVTVNTYGNIKEVDQLPTSNRLEKGFGSSGE